MNFCSSCGHRLAVDGADGTAPHRCEVCGTVHYLNPKILVSVVPVYQGKTLMIRRGSGYGKGLWAAPGGFMEQRETVEEAASRELFEETGIQVSPADLVLYALTSLRDISEVYIVYSAHLSSDEFTAGTEVLEAKWFSNRDIPWQQLAFHESGGFYKRLFEELESKRSALHVGRADSRGKTRTSYLIEKIAMACS